MQHEQSSGHKTPACATESLADTTTDTELLTILKRQQERIAELEATVESQQTRIDSLEATTDQLTDRLATLEETIDTHDTRLDRIDAHTEALSTKTATNTDRIEELQARELEKGAHLNAEHVTPGSVPVEAEQLERITKDGGQYYRLPDSEDPLDRGGEVQLAHGDLLPIQQLARMDEDMLHSATSSLPAKLAAKLWRAWVDPDVGDNPWQQGNRNVRVSVSASDLRHWIRRQEHGVSKAYAQKLVGRTIDAILELSNHRLAVRKHDQRKNGLQYTERRLFVPRDAAIPGHGTDEDPSTAGVLG